MLEEDGLPADVPHVFISAVTGLGITVLKDILWQALNASSILTEHNRTDLVHRSKTEAELEEINASDELDIPALPDEEDYEDIEELEDFEYEFDE